MKKEHNNVISSDTKEAVGGDWTKKLSPGDASTSAMTLHGQHDGRSDSLWKIMKFISAFNRQETGIMGLGFFCSILAGGGMPVQGVIFAKCVVSLSLSPAQYSQLRTDVNYWSLMFLAVACGIWTVTTGQGVAFAYCSERL
jgi:ATP-binding cassette, subfamily B (MDR/TAP), member 1